MTQKISRRMELPSHVEHGKWRLLLGAHFAAPSLIDPDRCFDVREGKNGRRTKPMLVLPRQKIPLKNKKISKSENTVKRTVYCVGVSKK